MFELRMRENDGHGLQGRLVEGFDTPYPWDGLEYLLHSPLAVLIEWQTSSSAIRLLSTYFNSGNITSFLMW